MRARESLSSKNKVFITSVYHRRITQESAYRDLVLGHFFVQQGAVDTEKFSRTSLVTAADFEGFADRFALGRGHDLLQVPSLALWWLRTLPTE